MTNGLYDIEMHVNPFGINSRITYILRVYSIKITFPCLISRRNSKNKKMEKENMINIISIICIKASGVLLVKIRVK